MSRFLHNKLTVIAVVMLAVILVSGAAWAATSNQAEDFAPSLQTFPVQVLISEADADSPGVLLEDLNIAGAGFQASALVFLALVKPDGSITRLGGARANGAGAFLKTVQSLPEASVVLQGDEYTVLVEGRKGGVDIKVSAPVIFVTEK